MKSKKLSVRNPRLAWLPALVLAATLAACGGGGSAGLDVQPQSAKAAAVCNYSHVYVTVQAVRVQNAAGQWTDIALPAPQRIDLLNLGGGVLQALGAAPLAAGHYSEVRLVLSADAGSDGLANAVQPAGGTLAPLSVPGGEQSGLKLKGDISVSSGQFADIALQGFDACSAIVSAGNSGKYNLKPEISIQAQAVPQAGPEARQTYGGTVMPLPGGGFVTVNLDFYGGTWLLQRYTAAGQPTGAPTTITAAAGQIGSIAPLAGGGYAIIWVTSLGTWLGSDGNYHSVNQLYVQGFTAAGAPIGSPLPLAIVDPGAVSRPAAVPQVAALSNGGFVVVWGLQRSFGGNTFDTSVYAQRFTAAGAPDGSVQLVTPQGTGFLGVTGLTTGGYLVTWGDLSGSEGGARAFAADGTPLGPQHDAGSSWGDGAGPRGDLQPLQGGGAVMVWAVPNQHLMVQQFAPDGTPLPAQIVNDATASPGVALSAVGGLPDGGYVVAWAEAGGNVYARRYAANGTPVGAQTQINVTTTGNAAPSVIVLSDGSFTVAWSGIGTDGVRATYARTFPAGGLITGP
jgi:hypothetical protein